MNPDSVLYTMTGSVCDIITINHNSVFYTMTWAVCDIKTLNLYDDRRCLWQHGNQNKTQYGCMQYGKYNFANVFKKSGCSVYQNFAWVAESTKGIHKMMNLLKKLTVIILHFESFNLNMNAYSNLIRLDVYDIRINFHIQEWSETIMSVK